MNLTEAQQRREDETTERVVFNCIGCGRETVIHVGKATVLLAEQCGRCVGSDRVRPFVAAAPKGTRTGTHGGRRIANPDLRERRRAKALRASRTRMGEQFRAGCAFHGCEGHTHRKRSYATKAGSDGGRKR